MSVTFENNISFTVVDRISLSLYSKVRGAVFHFDTKVRGAVFHSDTKVRGAVSHSDDILTTNKQTNKQKRLSSGNHLMTI